MNHTITVNLSPDELSSLIESAVRKVLSDLTPSPPRVKEPELLSTTQVSVLLNVTTSTVYSYVHFRKIPYHKKSGKLYFKRSEIMKWIESGRYMTSDEISQTIFKNLQK